MRERQKDRIVELYQAAQDARGVAEDAGVAKSTGLRVFRQRGASASVGREVRASSSHEKRMDLGQTQLPLTAFSR